MNPKTDADVLFETYLRHNGRQDFLYEARLPETVKVPDYQLPSTPKPLLFEVKGFDAEIPQGFGYFDPYPPLRRKITKAAEKFKDLDEYSCSLVLHYSGPGLIFLDPPFIFGAMLGEVSTEGIEPIIQIVLLDESRSMSHSLAELLKLQAGERAELAMALWESLSVGERETTQELNPEQAAELDRRWAEHVARPDSAIPWDDVRRRLMDRE